VQSTCNNINGKYMHIS